MLTSKVCGEFDTFWRFFPDELKTSGEYDFKVGSINNYCPNRKCESDIDKINAGCLWLFKQFYGSSYNFSSNANGNMNIVTYIMTLISYKLNQKSQDGITTFNDFYSKHIQNAEEYKKDIDGVDDYSSYMDLINQKNELMDIDISVMSKFYDLFKNLCNMYINIGKKNKGGIYLEYAKNFANEYKKLFNDDDNNEGSSYNKILSALSSDYYNFEKNKVDGKSIEFPSLPTKKTVENVDIPNSEEEKAVSLSVTPESSSKAKISDSDSTLPSPSQVNKLILIPIIFVATLILLGIGYKYSLFGFRKRSQKQYLREKLKK
ncbi:PIR protein [Plasmodium yoelii]|uniref:PIR protein n=2 Tax=Plasmodium yoelii TaxID=5861 RepID=A0AAF0B233_PLAYO|nr:PIR protein [Plasmodium yoelii]WBY56998.1 PIR protein [Plasmodium yoelii yoelii]CDS44741.1 YIR protein [Plasmodium yoelii]VTZ77862.1 PIR protein [Plasmodium yoelii]|eukprot:XP_022810772.2 PIR protein [Plasmodium yoelii]